MKKKVFLSLLIILFSTVNVYAEKCSYYPGQGKIIVPTNANLQCNYDIDIKASKYDNLTVPNGAVSFNPNKITLTYNGDTGFFIVSGKDTTINKIDEIFTFQITDYPDVLDFNLYSGNDDLYFYNTHFTVYDSVTFDYKIYGCPQTFIMSTSVDISSYTFTSDVTVNPGAYDDFYLVYRSIDETGAVIHGNGKTYDAVLDYYTIENEQVVSGQDGIKKIKNYIDSTYGYDKYILESDRYNLYIQSECKSNIIVSDENNEGVKECTALLGQETIDLLKTIFTWVQIVSPILVIVYVTSSIIMKLGIVASPENSFV